MEVAPAAPPSPLPAEAIVAGPSTAEFPAGADELLPEPVLARAAQRAVAVRVAGESGALAPARLAEKQREARAVSKQRAGQTQYPKASHVHALHRRQAHQHSTPREGRSKHNNKNKNNARSRR